MSLLAHKNSKLLTVMPSPHSVRHLRNRRGVVGIPVAFWHGDHTKAQSDTGGCQSAKKFPILFRNTPNQGGETKERKAETALQVTRFWCVLPPVFIFYCTHLCHPHYPTLTEKIIVSPSHTFVVSLLLLFVSIILLVFSS